jgi:hypothetical protein
MKPILTTKEITDVFVNTHLEENYNFLQADLTKLAEAFIKAAKPKIEKAERDLCVDIAKSVNILVANKIETVRKQM